MVPDETRSLGRFVADAATLGFQPPPVPIRAKLLHTQHHWSLYVQPPPGTPLGPVAEWLGNLTPLRIAFGTRSILRADLDPPPRAWVRLFHDVIVDVLRIDPQGHTVATVSGPHASVSAFARRITGSAALPEVQRLVPEPGKARLLTAAQDQALRLAVANGYYRIPRPLNLHQLARKLDITSASLSERLRRAEGRVITRYVNEGGVSPWDSRTIFDARADERDANWPDGGAVEDTS